MAWWKCENQSQNPQIPGASWHLEAGILDHEYPGPLAPEHQDLQAQQVNCNYNSILSASTSLHFKWLFWHDMVEKQEPHQVLLTPSGPIELSWRQWSLADVKFFIKKIWDNWDSSWKLKYNIASVANDSCKSANLILSIALK